MPAAIRTRSPSSTGRKAAGPEDRFALFLAAEMIMLGKYSNQEDVIIGTTAAETGSGGVLNLLALRGKPEKRKTFDEFLTEVREYCRKANYLLNLSAVREKKLLTNILGEILSA